MTKILIIRFSSIGDIVLTTPVIRCLFQQMEGVELHYLTKKTFAPVLGANPYLHKIHTIQETTSEAIEELKTIQFDHIIDLHRNIRSAGVKRKLKATAYTFDKINIKKWQAVNFKAIHKLPNVHIVDRYLDAVAPLDVKNDGQGLDYFIAPADEVSISSLPPTHRQGYVAWVIGGAHATKCMPFEKLVEVGKQLTIPVLLLGGGNDMALGQRLTDTLGDQVYNACGKFNINQSASLVQQAQKVITHDTGLMHIAAAFKKKIISVWGNTIPQFGMYPYMPGNESYSKIVEVGELNCRPCSKIGYEKCPKKHFNCMQYIDATAIAKWVNE